MLLYCRHLKHKIYDNIRSIINDNYSIDTSYSDDIIMNALPIKYKDNYWILSNIAGLEISSLELDRQLYEIKYVIDEKTNGTIPITKANSLHELEPDINYDLTNCFYDEHLDIMFIKFQDVLIEYIDISDYKFSWFNQYENTDIIIGWLNNMLEQKNITFTNNKIIFEDKFINLPIIPYVVSSTKLINELTDRPILDYPCTGAKLTDLDGKILGIVSYVNSDNIVSIPINLITRSLDYLNLNSKYKLNMNFVPIQINYKNELDRQIVEYGLYLQKNNKRDNNNIITSIDNYSISLSGHLLINDYEIPISTYLWLFKKENMVKIKSISSSILNDFRINKEDDELYSVNFIHSTNIKLRCYTMKLSDKLEESLSVTKLNYVEYNGKYLIEVNEKIMQILKILFQTTDKYDKLYDYIIDNKFSSKKIVISINTRMKIKIIKKIKNTMISGIKSVVDHFEQVDNLKNYIKNI